MSMPCMYCFSDASAAKGVEHIIPESLGYKEVLPQGYVCDNCNSYFGTSIDKSIVHNRIIAFQLLADRTSGKKGKPRKQIGKRLSSLPNGRVGIMLGPATVTSGTKQIDFKLEQNKEFDDLEFARGVHKIALNCLAKWRGNGEALSHKYNHLRRYIRQPHKNELRPYGVKESESNGDFVAEFFMTKSDVFVELHRLSSLDFLVLLTEGEIERKLRRRSDNYIIITRSGQWNNSSLIGLQS